MQRLHAELAVPGKKQYAEVLFHDRKTKLYFDYDEYAEADAPMAEQDVLDRARNNLQNWLSSIVQEFVASDCIWLVRSGEVEKKGKM